MAARHCRRAATDRKRAKAIAEQQRQRAEDTLAAATKTANSLVFDLAVRFRDTLGIPANLVKDILDRARALQDQLIKSGQVTPALRYSQAASLTETAASLLTIGDAGGALSAAEQARQIMADLVAGNPREMQFQRQLAMALLKIGKAQQAQGDLASALKSYRDDLAITDLLAKSDPSNAQWQRDLEVSYLSIGDVQVAQGNLASALKTTATLSRLLSTWQSPILAMPTGSMTSVVLTKKSAML